MTIDDKMYAPFINNARKYFVYKKKISLDENEQTFLEYCQDTITLFKFMDPITTWTFLKVYLMPSLESYNISNIHV